MSPVPVMLAIETSQRIGSVALRDSTGAVHTESLRQSRRHDDDLIPAIDRLVNGGGLSPAAIQAVAVSLGPGGFTGLRIAVTTAKMLGETLGVTLLGVPSAMVAAESCELAYGPIAVALASKRSSFWLTTLNRAHVDDPWTACGKPGIIEADAWDLAGLRRVLADSHLPDVARARCDAANIAITEPRFDATACLCIGDGMLRAGLAVDPISLVPIYPRQPEAVKIWDQRISGDSSAMKRG